jgi:NAD(P)-dependent dehydrogenase (short-subunit alcohol dehydrogenase family)
MRHAAPFLLPLLVSFSLLAWAQAQPPAPPTEPAPPEPPMEAAEPAGRANVSWYDTVGFHYPEMAAFSSAKAAIECLIKCAANEWSEHGIVANAIALSTISTPKVLDSKPLAKEESYVTPEELCMLIEDVLFAESPYLNGNVIRPLKQSRTFYNRSYFERNPPNR